MVDNSFHTRKTYTADNIHRRSLGRETSEPGQPVTTTRSIQVTVPCNFPFKLPVTPPTLLEGRKGGVNLLLGGDEAGRARGTLRRQHLARGKATFAICLLEMRKQSSLKSLGWPRGWSESDQRWKVAWWDGGGMTGLILYSPPGGIQDRSLREIPLES
eukprot:761769-Hanusia_phi.AAC.3